MNEQDRKDNWRELRRRIRGLSAYGVVEDALLATTTIVYAKDETARDKARRALTFALDTMTSAAWNQFDSHREALSLPTV